MTENKKLELALALRTIAGKGSLVPRMGDLMIGWKVTSAEAADFMRKDVGLLPEDVYTGVVNYLRDHEAGLNVVTKDSYTETHRALHNYCKRVHARQRKEQAESKKS